MKKFETVIGIFFICVLILALAGCTNQTPPATPPTNNPPATNPPAVQPSGPQTYDVEIKNFAFSQSTLTIKKGDTVKWTNNDGASHTVVSDSGSEINSGTLAPGQSYSHTFNDAGTFAYHCAIHPSMKAKIIVE